MILKIKLDRPISFFHRYANYIVVYMLVFISVYCFYHYLNNGLGLAYNDARSHLDIGRRVVEGLKPGLAQIGSVWLPLPHLLMVPTIWMDYFWHTGLAGALQSMVGFVLTGLLIYKVLEKLGVGIISRLIGVLVFVANINVLYLQSTAMTELLLMGTMTASVYYLISWFGDQKVLNLIKVAFWVMLASLVRYDGWFLLFFTAALVGGYTLFKKGYKNAEGVVILFCTLAALGVFLWLVWNLLIFKDPLYFALGPFSARAQQVQMESAGVLFTKGNLLLSLKVYFYAFIYNSYALSAFAGVLGFGLLCLDKKTTFAIKLGSLALLVPFLFNVIALYFGHSVLFIQGLVGGTWFNVRYGVLMMPSLAIFVGFLAHKLQRGRVILVGMLVLVTFFAFVNGDAVCIDDARVGSSQKNVSEVSGWLNVNVMDKPGYVLISAASHDAIIFSSGLTMSRFIHEGTGAYWSAATTNPDKWARWIIMRTYDDNDLTWRSVSKTAGFLRYNKIKSYPFADIYQLDDKYLPELNTSPSFGKQR